MEEFKDPARTPATYRKLRTLSRICAVLVSLIGFLVLLGWIFDITLLKSIRNDTVPMNPLVALGFIAAGVALWLHEEELGEKYRKKADLLAYFILLIGILKLVSVVTGLDIPFDEILFRKQLWLPDLNAYRTIAPNTALNFTMSGLALLFINYETKKGRRPSQFLAVGVTLLALLSLYGYLYGVPALYEIRTFMPMSINTGFGFFLLGVGILFSRPDKGSMAVVIGENSGQIIFMRFIAFLLPLVYGWLKIHGENSGLFSREFGTALFAILTYIVSMFFLARQSVLQHKIRETRRQAMEAIKENERRLQSILDHSGANISLKTLLGKYTLVNKHFEKDFNRDLTSVIGKTDYDLFPKDMARELNLYDHQIIRTGLPKNFEEKYPQEDGIHTYLTVKFPLFTQEGKIYALGAISTDITQRKELEEKLRKSEERYSLALKGTNDGLWDWDIKNDYLFLSARWKEMLGYEEDEIANTIEAWENQLHPDDHDKTMANIQDYFDKKIPLYEVEFRMRHKDGSYRWMLDRGMALWDEDNKPYRMIGYQTDLTERKRLEAELRKSHQRLFSILDNIGEGVVVADKDGNYIIFNKRAEEILGVGSISETWDEWTRSYGVFLPDGVTYFPENEMPLYRALHGESADNVELYIRNEKFPFGRWIAVTGRPVMDDKQQEIIAGVIIFRDITPRKQLEKLFVDNEKRLKVILASIGEGIIILNQDEHVLLFNSKAEEILGTGPKDLNLKKWPEFYGIYEPEGISLIPAEDLPMVKALKGEPARKIEIMIRNKNVPEGKHIYLAGRTIKDNKGNVSGCIVDFQDITEQRKLEEYVQEIQEQFHELVKLQRPSV